jgi:hypothetical protein
MKYNVGRKHVTLYQAGCGTRRNYKAYLQTNHSWFEQYPLSYFVYDPPIHVESLLDWGLCDQGISYMQSGGVYHAMTVVGLENYPNVADILEEWKNGWSSTLVPLMGEGVRLLTPVKSRLLIFSRAGWLPEYKKYRKSYIELETINECFLPDVDPIRKEHLKGKDMCASLHWQHVTGGTLIDTREPRKVGRKIGQAYYEAVGPIDEIPATDYALVAWRPIDELNLIDPAEAVDKSPLDEALEFLLGSTGTPCQLPIFLTDN